MIRKIPKQKEIENLVTGEHLNMVEGTRTLKLACCVVLSCSVMSDSATSWTVAHQAPLFVGILQAKILEWVAMPSSRGSSQPRDPALQADSLPSEPPGKPWS